MTKLDHDYLEIARQILKDGCQKHTRAGDTRSLFGMRIETDLREGFPLLTTKKVFYKGIIHELLWFLQRPCNRHGSMNIWYLVQNNVHIWDDDAFRWFHEWVGKHLTNAMDYDYFKVNYDDEYIKHEEEYQPDTFWEEGQDKKKDLAWLKNLDKQTFLGLVREKVEIKILFGKGEQDVYRFGDLGPVYGKQWRSFGVTHRDQIQNIIDTLKTNPDDRRMLCVAFNPDVLDEVALPPCHVMFQFYANEIGLWERVNYFAKHTDMWHGQTFDSLREEALSGKSLDPVLWQTYMDSADVPSRMLSCMWSQRSGDAMVGIPYNIASYALLTHMVAHVVNMIPFRLIGSFGDTHIYENHIEGMMEQTHRKGADHLPTLKINRKVDSINDFKYEDFSILNYESDSPIKYALNVG